MFDKGLVNIVVLRLGSKSMNELVPLHKIFLLRGKASILLSYRISLIVMSLIMTIKRRVLLDSSLSCEIKDLVVTEC